MAWPWVTIAVKSIPWAALARRAPDIIDAAGSLLTARKVSQAAKHVAAQTETQLGELRERVEILSEHDQETARVVQQIAEQMRDLTDGIEVLAAKIRLQSILLGATLVVAVVALWLAMA